MLRAPGLDTCYLLLESRAAGGFTRRKMAEAVEEELDRSRCATGEGVINDGGRTDDDPML